MLRPLHRLPITHIGQRSLVSLVLLITQLPTICAAYGQVDLSYQSSGDKERNSQNAYIEFAQAHSDRDISDALVILQESTSEDAINFSDYPADLDLGVSNGTGLPDFLSRDSWAKYYRSEILRGVRLGPNFAGHYRLIEIGCGSSCKIIFVVDSKDGHVFQFPYGGEDEYDMTLQYRINSRLVRVIFTLNLETCVQSDLDFNGESFIIAQKVIFPRMHFCEF